MKDDEQCLCRRLCQVEREIEETLRRLPPHSIKAPVMIDLLALEDERDILLKKLVKLGWPGGA